MFKTLYVKQNEHGEQHMKQVTNEIIAIQTKARECNGDACARMSAKRKAWCEQNGIKASTYYARLRKLREKVCREIVPIEAPQTESISEIQITSGDITISLL